MSIYRQPLHVIIDQRNLHDRRMLEAGTPEFAAPEWLDVTGETINDDRIASDVFVTSDHKDGFFYMRDEPEGKTIYHVNLETFRVSLASEPKQFLLPQDHDAICEQLAHRRTTPEYVKESYIKGKGHSAANVILFTRNKARSESLAGYRKKMRERQVPLKVDKQWEFFTTMVEDGQLTAAALEQVVFLARDVEAARSGSEPNIPDGWTAETGRAGYIVAAVEG